MSTRYVGFLHVPGNLKAVGYFNVVERYNGGWAAMVVLSVVDGEGEELTLPATLGTVLTNGVVPGGVGVVRLGTAGASGGWIRTWPGFITSVEPYNSASIAGSYCKVVVEDVVSYLGHQRIWGAFRGHSAAETVGGALSLAAGTEGRATLNPAVPNHPRIRIAGRLRFDLDFIPYAIAAGHTLAEWLDEFFGLLGVRMELVAGTDAALTIILSDDVPRDPPLRMSLETGAGTGTAAANGELAILGVAGHHGTARRATLLDDPTKGNFRRLGPGPIGTLVTGTEVSLEEAVRRSECELRGRAAELLMVVAETRQPAIRPGRVVALSAALFGERSWQVSWAKHELRGDRYENEIELMAAKFSWHPARPVKGAMRIVPAFVDAGSEYGAHETVPRDHLGRILVRFPFAPTLKWEDAAVRHFDVNFDERITKDDFAHLIGQRYTSDGEATDGDDYDADVTRRRWEEMDADEMRQRMKDAGEQGSGLSDAQRYEAQALADTEAREADVKALDAGEYDDPFPGRSDDELTVTENAQRWKMRVKRERTYRYIAWKRALAFEESGGDHDHDGYVTALDEAMSDELREAFADPEERARIEREARERAAAADDAGPSAGDAGPSAGDTGPSAGDTGPSAGGGSDAGEDLVDEYLRLFGEDSTDPAAQMAELQRDAADEQWPARLPLPVVQPMAGGLHGFVTAHRQGDACRVAVHDVLCAEIVGFQYRSDRELVEGIGGAIAGIVVEHNLFDSWSGMMFRKVGEPESG